jgi:hypothetical protein
MYVRVRWKEVGPKNRKNLMGRRSDRIKEAGCVMRDNRISRTLQRKSADVTKRRSCFKCGLVFEEASPIYDYLANQDGSVVCRDAISCRSRMLSVRLGVELGQLQLLFLKYPRDLVYGRMDIRPANWREAGWRPRYRLAERIMACILYHSWCYPVCTEYAVRLARTCANRPPGTWVDDEILCDQYGRFTLLREKDIACILNEHPSYISRAIKQLRANRDIRIDQDRAIFPAAKLAEMSITERLALCGQELVDTANATSGKDRMLLIALKGVPQRFRGPLRIIRDHCPEDIRDGIFREVGSQCAQFNDRLREIRAARDAGIQEICSQGTAFLQEWGNTSRWSSERPSPLLSAPFQSPEPSVNDEGGGSSTES